MHVEDFHAALLVRLQEGEQSMRLRLDIRALRPVQFRVGLMRSRAVPAFVKILYMPARKPSTSTGET
ncbi:hypothetical protein ACIA5H_34450 [Nocardia sp. NPDC051900]|uniref:hypothetical protein n=1 Tax=Nocardia sp. NPDC051900 TaxID=3364326 RepID=UPI00379EC4B2